MTKQLIISLPVCGYALKESKNTFLSGEKNDNAENKVEIDGFWAFINDLRYLAVVGGTFIEGETTAIMGGFVAHRGYLALPLVMLATFIGSILNDQLYFFIGRIKGKVYLDKHPSLNPRVSNIRRLLDRYNMLILVGFRFFYG